MSLVWPQGEIRIKFVFAPLRDSQRIYHALGKSTGGGMVMMNQAGEGILTIMSSAKCHILSGGPKIPYGTPD